MTESSDAGGHSDWKLQAVTPLLPAAQALQLLETMVKHGAERVVDDARDHLFRIRLLTDFQFHNEQGQDMGVVGTYQLHWRRHRPCSQDGSEPKHLPACHSARESQGPGQFAERHRTHS